MLLVVDPPRVRWKRVKTFRSNNISIHFLEGMYETLDVWSKDAIYPKKAKKIQVDQKSGQHSKSVLVEFAQLKRVLIKRCTCTKGNFNLLVEEMQINEEEYCNILISKNVGLILNSAWIIIMEANIFIFCIHTIQFNFDEFFIQIFLTNFLVKLKLSTAKKSKTTTFSRVFHPKKSTIFSGNQSWIFGQKMKISNSVWKLEKVNNVHYF